MACTSAGSWWRRVGRGAARDAGRLVLASAGVVIILVQVFVPAVAAVDIPALALGVAVLVFGVVLPSAAEAEIGPHGLQYKATVRDRDAAVDVAFPEAEIASLAWFAAHLVGDEGRGRDLVEDALTRTYADWHLIDAHERRFSVLCMLVRLALGRGALGLLQQPVPPAGTTAALAALHPRDRALLLLRHYADLDEEQIAAVMDRSLEELRADLAVAEAALDAALQGPAMEPTGPPASGCRSCSRLTRGHRGAPAGQPRSGPAAGTPQGAPAPGAGMGGRRSDRRGADARRRGVAGRRRRGNHAAHRAGGYNGGAHHAWDSGAHTGVTNAGDAHRRAAGADRAASHTRADGDRDRAAPTPEPTATATEPPLPDLVVGIDREFWSFTVKNDGPVDAPPFVTRITGEQDVEFPNGLPAGGSSPPHRLQRCCADTFENKTVIFDARHEVDESVEDNNEDSIPCDAVVD